MVPGANCWVGVMVRVMTGSAAAASSKHRTSKLPLVNLPTNDCFTIKYHHYAVTEVTIGFYITV